jgi:chorismate mutase
VTFPQSVANVHYAIARVSSNTDTLFQFSLPFSLLSKLPQMHAINCEDVDSVTVTVSDVHIAFPASAYPKAYRILYPSNQSI